jgi:AraC family transcriptional regulator
MHATPLFTARPCALLATDRRACNDPSACSAAEYEIVRRFARLGCNARAGACSVSGGNIVAPAHWYATLPVPSLAGEVKSDLAMMLRCYRGTHALMDKPGLTDDLICVHQGGAKRIHRWQAGLHRSWDVPQDAVSTMPRFHANRWWTEGPVAFTHVTLSGGLLARLARDEFDRDPRDLTVIDQVGVLDPLVVQLVGALAETLRSPLPWRLYREGLLTALMIRILTQHSSMGAQDAPAQARGGLAGWQLRRVVDYMMAHLTEDLGAAELLGLTGLSRAQFFRAFRQSTGQTPGGYLLALRLDRARHLLQMPAGTVGDVARAVGFRDAESFARAFKRATGLSPAAWRQHCRRQG